MNIMELCLSPGRGGLELYMARTAIALAKSHTILPVIARGEKPIHPYLHDGGVAPVGISVWLHELPLAAAPRLARLIDRARIDVIHAHWRGDLPLAAIAKWLSRTRPRLVYTCQMKISHGKNDPYHNFVYGQVDVLLTITRQLQEQVRRRLHPRFGDRVRLLYYGTEVAPALSEGRQAALRQQFAVAPGQYIVGLFGQKHEGKGQHLLLRALGRLKADGVDVKGLLVGPTVDPAYLARLTRQIDELDLEADIALIDFVDNPQELMQICDCVVLATYQETFGLVLIEAMSAGTAVIGSDAGGVPEIIDDGESGLLFETRNSDSLCDKLAVLYHQRELRERLARAGQKKAREQFGAERHYRELEAVLEGQARGGMPQ